MPGELVNAEDSTVRPFHSVMSSSDSAVNLQDFVWKLLPLVVSLAIVFIGSWLTHNIRRREWIADNKKNEYKKLLRDLARLNLALVDYESGKDLRVGPRLSAIAEATVELNSCIFISEFLEKTTVISEVLDAAKQLTRGGSFADYEKRYWNAVNTIISTARKISL